MAPPASGTRRQRPLDHGIDVGDAARLLECSQIERQLQFQHLVRRYMSQILYGCSSTCCTTPTCLSCNKRLVSRPFRPPTQLTARALAFYLASQDHPHRSLCPHEMNVDPSTLEIEGAHGVHIHSHGGSHDPICHVYPRAPSHAPAPLERGLVTRGGGGTGTGSGIEDDGEAKRITDAIARRHQTRKDPKSLGQNLYDTVTMIFAYSKHIPSPSSVFASLASPFDQEHHGAQTPMRTTVIDAKRDHDSPPSTHRTSADATASTVNDRRSSKITSPQSLRRNSRRIINSNATSITSEILSNGQRIHRIRHVPNDLDNGPQPVKPSGTFSLNGTLDGAIDGVTTRKSRVQTTHGLIGIPAAPTASVSLPEHSTDERDVSIDLPKNEQHSSMIVTPYLTCDIMDRLKEDVYHHRREQSRDLNFVVDYDANKRFRPAKPSVNRSIFFTLSDPETLLRSFRDQASENYKFSPLPHLHAPSLTHAFRDWDQRNGSLVFDSLWNAVEALFRPPPELDTQKSPRLKPSRKDATPQLGPHQPNSPDTFKGGQGRYLSDAEAAHIIMICLHALTSLVPNGWPHTWVQVRKLRGWGVVVPGAPPQTERTDGFAHPWLEIVDHLEYEPAVRLATRLLQGIGTRRCFEHILASIHTRDGPREQISASPEVGSLLPLLLKHLLQVEKAALDRRAKTKNNQHTDDDPGWTVTATFIEWLRTVIVKQWDGNVEINKWGSVGTAVTFMAQLHAHMEGLNLRPNMFLIPHFNELMDGVQQPIDFLKHKARPNSFHILQYPMFFSQNAIVGYFRAINFNRMFKQFEKSARIVNFQSRWDHIVNNSRHWNVAMENLGVALAEYLVLDVSRQSPLEETLDQLWGQEKRKLLKPLKVRIGISEGEVGLDQGGVTYEYFRLVLNEAFRPDNGMFTVDAQTSMTWFQPASLEPLWKFQMLGILFSLAVYNGITLPVTFPLALYDYLLEEEHTSKSTNPVAYIADGWPILARSFREFLDCRGEVEDIYMRDYTFSFEAFGQSIDVDMQAFNGRPWPSPDLQYDPESSQARRGCQDIPDLSNMAWRQHEQNEGAGAPPVTNANREQYIKDYVEWLTRRSVLPQLEAFARGFHTCLHRTSLSLFTSHTLRALVEGEPTISIPLLKRVVRYEGGYSAEHRTIVNFWAIVQDYSAEEKKQLLEFVTANERIPVTGYDSVHFSVVRFGGDTESLPTSSTCFGKLYLPEYADEEKMRDKLGVAIRNSEGFGIV